MANFPAGVIYIWTGTNATIPTGWERVTALDGLYPKGTANATNPNDTGGAATHEHTGTTHSHTDSHTHTISFGTANLTGLGRESTADNIASHGHSNITSGAVSGGGLSSVACTYAAYSNDPPYYSVIFITPTTGTTYFPQNGVYLYNGTDEKTGHRLCDGDNSTPNLVDKYLKGAGTGADAGGTGGSTTNVHNLTHTHTVASHTHAAATSGGAINATIGGTNSGTGYAHKTHTHSVTLGSKTDTISSTAPSLTTSETVEPAYTKLLTVQNQNTGSGSYRVGMIGMWVGTLASIPSNYVLCDGTNGTQDMRGKYHKSTATTGSIGDTGGSNTHTHASQNHTHTASGTHTHTTPTTVDHTHVSTVKRWDDDVPFCQASDTHSVSNAASTSVYSNAATTGDEQNNEPEYRTVAFIKLNSTGSSASMLMNFL